MNVNKISLYTILPVLFSFFIMGFVDIVGISTSYVQNDFDLDDKMANILPSMVFIWFAIFSLPVGILMNRIGRRNTVLLSAIVTFIAMTIPVVSYSYIAMLSAFALLGIGNTILQVSLNPLMMNVVPQSKITSMLTLGQFVKAIASTLGPVLVAAMASLLGHWSNIFILYAVLTALSSIWMWMTHIDEDRSDNVNTTSINDLLSLFKVGYLILMFCVIILCVGFEIGLMTCSPKLLSERGLSINEAGQGNTIYYIARTISTFAGAIILSKVSPKKFLTITITWAIVALVCLITIDNALISFISLFTIGLMFANVFAIAYSSALQFKPEMANEISALMIMGVAGGALLPPIMGIVSDNAGQAAGMIVLLLALSFILFTSFKIKEENKLKQA